MQPKARHMVTRTGRWIAGATLVTTLSIAGLMAASNGTDAGELRLDDLTFSTNVPEPIVPCVLALGALLRWTARRRA